MGIQISTPESVPAITYDRIHMTKMDIVQPLNTNDAQTPKYEVIINYRLYGVVDGVRYYKDEVKRVSISDYIALATANYQNNQDDTLLTAFVSIEQAIAKIIAEQTGTTTSII